jgi:FkbM family methyltransferase
LPAFRNNGTDIFIDAGAYVGDTVEKFIWENNGVFSHIYAFEPGPAQFNALKKRMARIVDEWAIPSSKITCVDAGLADKEKEGDIACDTHSLTSSSFISLSGRKSNRVRLCSLDSFLGTQPVTFIKADIEGFELDMLRGATSTISRDKPKIAVSIYHKPWDIYEITEYIHSLVPDYNMAIRHHAPSLIETVLYCWIDD